MKTTMDFAGKDPEGILKYGKTYQLKTMTCYKQGFTEHPEVWAEAYEGSARVKTLRYPNKEGFDLDWTPSRETKECDICGKEFDASDSYVELRADFVNWDGLSREYLVLCPTCSSKLEWLSERRLIEVTA